MDNLSTTVKENTNTHTICLIAKMMENHKTNKSQVFR